MKRFTLLIISLLTITHAWSQNKNEREERIALQSFPASAITLIESLPSPIKRIRFYKEQDGDKTSFEAKFKYKRQNYSLEFDTEGIIEDIEVIIKINKVESMPAVNIETYFKNTYSKSKLIKVQQQYLYDASINAQTFVSDILNTKSTAKINYEIVAEVTADGQRSLKEFTFDSAGAFLNVRTVNPSSYDYVLY
jgi:hypothetical protein